MKSARVEVHEGPLADADLVIEAGPAMRSLMAGEVTASEALEAGIIRVVRGDVTLLEQFAHLFRVWSHVIRILLIIPVSSCESM